MGKINTTNYPNRPVSAYQDDDMFILQDNGGETYTTNVGDIKNLADSRIKLEGVQVNGTDLPISGKKVNVDISGKTDLSVIAYTFNSEMGYFKGAYVTYNGKLYEFIQEHTGTWNPSHAREIKAAGQYVRAGNGGYNSGDRATCEGYMTKASGNYSHAEGRETQAVGDCTHAEGRGTIANSIYQHVEGKYNVADNESKYIHIIGNGINDNDRSNALTLDWDGNLEVSGEVEDGNGEKISDKTDKVTNATSGHLAGLDSNGNLTDSGVSPTEDVTVEGNPVTFDSPFEQDAKSVVVSVKPIQDLHGYDHPWPAGGGKNKLPLTVEGIKAANINGTWSGNIYTIGNRTFEILVDSADNITGIKVNGSDSSTHTFDLNIPVNLGINAILNGCPVGGTEDTYEMMTMGTSSTYRDRGTGVTFEWNTDVMARIIIRGGYSASNLVFQPMARLSSVADATFAPYSNICPISGIDEVEIGVSGRNIWNERLELGSINSNGENAPSSSELRSIDYIRVDPNTDYYFYEGFSPAYHDVYFYDENKSFISQDSTDVTAFTTPLNVHFMRFRLNSSYGITYRNDICINVSDASFNGHYEPYNPNSHTTTIPLPSTLYDADVDVTEGDVDNRFGMVDENANWVFAERSSSYTISSYVTFEDASIKTNGSGMVNFLPINNQGAWNSETPVAQIFFFDGEHGIRIYDNFESLEDFRQKYSGLQFVYELATPTTLSFDPADVELLEGTNVVSTNGEKVAVTYGRSLWQDIDELKTDTEGKLDKSDVATIEGDTASKAYSVNDFMLRADGLYKVTAPIASGASITASNTTKTTVGEVLTALLNA